MEYFVSGIGTDVGKTVVSALLCETLQANYWKPVQAGDLDNSDSIKVRRWIDPELTVFPEAHRLNTPASPHFAAELDGVEIQPGALRLPESERKLIIEGAGGLLVPLNRHHTYADLLQVWDIPVILVSRNYLGSINHTLMSIEVLQQRGIPLAGIVFNGEPTPSTESIIASYSDITVLGHVPQVDRVDREFIRAFSREWKEELLTNLNERHPLNEAIERKVRLNFPKKENRPHGAAS
jgi:dethiobiotin synthetase